MSALSQVLDDASDLLRGRGVRFALVGGLAVSARTEPRFTRDVDLAVTVRDDDAAEAVVNAFAPGYSLTSVLEHDTLGRMVAARLRRTGISAAGVVVDLLFASSGIEEEVVADAEPLEVFAGVSVPVARTGHLLALKLLARDDRRPLDAADLRALLAVADEAERARAEDAVDRIVRRGANRGRDLRAEWRRLLADAS